MKDLLVQFYTGYGGYFVDALVFLFLYLILGFWLFQLSFKSGYGKFLYAVLGFFFTSTFVVFEAVTGFTIFFNFTTFLLLLFGVFVLFFLLFLLRGIFGWINF